MEKLEETHDDVRNGVVEAEMILIAFYDQVQKGA